MKPHPEDDPIEIPAVLFKLTAQDLRFMILYGITASDYAAILHAQNSACAICRRVPKNNRLSVDHDHKNGITRGLLCWGCNKAIAYLRDDEHAAHRAALYLTTPTAHLVLRRRPMGRVGRSTRQWKTKREKIERMTWVVAELERRGFKIPKRLAVYRVGGNNG